MLTAEPYKIQANSSYLIHRGSPWYERLNKKVDEIIEINSNKEDLETLLNTYEDYCKTTKKDISMIRIDSEDYEKKLPLIKSGFQMTEISYNISCAVGRLENIQLVRGEFTTSCDIQDLLRLTDNMFRHGRFAEDPLIDKEVSNMRYKNYVSDLVNQNTSGVFMQKKGALVAFMFYEQKNKEVYLKLGGVKNQHVHLVPSFWSHVLSSFNKDMMINTLISAVNTPVLNLYNYFGFKVKQAVIGYHKHHGGKK